MNPRTHTAGGRFAKAVALLVIGSWCWILPSQAAAQGLLGWLIVTVTSPSSGSPVSGTIQVKADVSIVGFLTVVGVQFKVDGVNVGAEDTSKPYEVSWNTTNASNGSHTLTAVARDLLGVRWTSNPVTVTVSNPPTITSFTPTSGPVGTSVTISGTRFTGATAVRFNGTSASFTVSSATSIQATVPGGATTGPISVTTSGGTATSAASFTVSAPALVTRVEDTNAAITYTPTDTWVLGNTDRTWSGGTAALGFAAGQRATLSFSGTGASWIGFRGPQAGIADIYLDGARVSTVDAYASEEAIGAVLYTASGLVPGTHTLAIEATGTKNALSTDFFVVVDAFDVLSGDAPSSSRFAPGDVLVSLETGPVQWRLPNGTLRATLVGTVRGTGEGMAFDAAGNLYVSRWCIDPACTDGNTVEKFNPAGQSLGAVGRGYDCGPHAVVFDAAGAAYVGEGGCRGRLLKFVPGAVDPIEFAVAPDHQGAFWIDLAPDGCTMFYTSYGPNVKRFDVCRGSQLPDFNAAPLPGGAAQDLRVLPDGGVLVSSGEVIARLNASGSLIQTYAVPPEPSLWAGLDLVGDGTFWVGNYESSNVYRFDLASGAVVSSFNTGTPSHTVVGVRVKK